MQNIIVGPLKSPVYKFVLTGTDVLSKCLFVAPLTNASANSVATELTMMIFVHSYIPKNFLADLGKTFKSDLMHRLAALLEIQINHATLKHPQTIGLLEQSHGPLKRFLKLNTIKQWSVWLRYVPPQHSSTIHRNLHQLDAAQAQYSTKQNSLDLHFSSQAMETVTAESAFVVTALQDAMLEKFIETKKNLISAYQKYRGYYDQIALAQPLKFHSFCLLLNPLLTSQSVCGSESMHAWIPLYGVEKVLTNSNYIFLKMGTNYTQCVHPFRRRPVDPQHHQEHLETFDPSKIELDPSLGKYRSEPGLFDDYLPKLPEDI